MNKNIIYIFFFIAWNHLIFSEQEKFIDPTIIIYVHGTTLMRKILQSSPLRSFMYCPQGLSLAKNLPHHYHFYKIAKGCIELNDSLYSFEQFYIFGWQSEHVNNSARIKAAAELVSGLQLIINSYYAEHGIVPKIRLIGFSHGGNVILHTANYLPLYVHNKKVEIEAWLFATPVQQVNHHLVNDENFNKVYSVFSKKDWLQRIDPQGLRNKQLRKTHFWSDRTFDVDARCIQVDFRVNSKSISHNYYRSIFKYFPLIQELIEGASQGLNSGIITVDFKI